MYAYLPYAISAAVTWLLLVDVAVVTLSAFTLIGLLATIDAWAVREQLSRTPARWVGGALTVIGLLAYAGLAANAASTLAEAGARGHWVADCTVGTPVLVLAGVLLWRRVPLGYVAAPGLLLVSALGGVVFAIAAAVNNLLAGPATEPATIVVHLVISALSTALLVVFVRRVTLGRGATRSRARFTFTALDTCLALTAIESSPLESSPLDLCRHMEDLPPVTQPLRPATVVADEVAMALMRLDQMQLVVCVGASVQVPKKTAVFTQRPTMPSALDDHAVSGSVVANSESRYPPGPARLCQLLRRQRRCDYVAHLTGGASIEDRRSRNQPLD